MLIWPESPCSQKIFIIIEIKKAEKLRVDRSKKIFRYAINNKLLQWNMNSPLPLFQSPLASLMHLRTMVNRVERLEVSIGLHRNCSLIALLLISQLKEPLDHLAV